jgi:hypothetical protein
METVSLRRRSTPARLHGAASQKAVVLMLAAVRTSAIQGFQPSGYFPDCPDFIFPVRNKMNTHSGWRKFQKFYNLQNFLMYITAVYVKYNVKYKVIVVGSLLFVKYDLCHLCLYPVFSK